MNPQFLTLDEVMEIHRDQIERNAYAFDSGDASAWRVNGGFRLEIPRNV